MNRAEETVIQVACLENIHTITAMTKSERRTAVNIMYTYASAGYTFKWFTITISITPKCWDSSHPFRHVHVSVGLTVTGDRNSVSVLDEARTFSIGRNGGIQLIRWNRRRRHTSRLSGARAFTACPDIL